MRRTFLTIVICSLPFSFVWAAPKLAPAKLEGKVTEDLDVPYNLQVRVINRSVSLSWAWDPPNPGPQFLTFGYEVYRDTAVIAIVPDTAYTDFSAEVGTHTYKVRTKGGSIDLGRKYAHVSDWSESVDAEIKMTCAGAPTINLQVTPNKSVFRG